MTQFDVGLLGGRARSLRRHLDRRGEQTKDQLFDHFVAGAHEWHPEDLDRAIGELVANGLVFEPGVDGLVALVVRSPL